MALLQTDWAGLMKSGGLGSMTVAQLKVYLKQHSLPVGVLSCRLGDYNAVDFRVSDPSFMKGTAMSGGRFI